LIKSSDVVELALLVRVFALIATRLKGADE